MKVKINTDDGWAEVDMRDCLKKGDNFDGLANDVGRKIDEAFEMDCAYNLGLHHAARYVVGVLDVVGRRMIVAVKQDCSLVSNEPSRDQWEYTLQHSGDVKSMLLTPGLFFSGNGAYLYNSPDKTLSALSREEWDAYEAAGDKDAYWAAVKARHQAEFETWFNEMAARIKAQAEGRNREKVIVK